MSMQNAGSYSATNRIIKRTMNGTYFFKTLKKNCPNMFVCLLTEIY